MQIHCLQHLGVDENGNRKIWVFLVPIQIPVWLWKITLSLDFNFFIVKIGCFGYIHPLCVHINCTEFMGCSPYYIVSSFKEGSIFFTFKSIECDCMAHSWHSVNVFFLTDSCWLADFQILAAMIWYTSDVSNIP